METKTQQVATTDAKDNTLAAMFQSVVELATNPDVDPAKMQAIVDLQMNMMDRASREEFQKAKFAALMEMPSILKDGKITGKGGQVMSRYSHFESLDKVVRPILQKHNLVLTFDCSEGEGGRVLVTPILAHTNGHVERGGSMPLAIDTTGAKNATQGAGSALSYGKRHTMKAMLNIIEDNEDDDGTNKGRAGAAQGIESVMQGTLDLAQKEATKGSDAYAAFFGQLTNLQKGWLMDNGHHANLKQAAAEQ